METKPKKREWVKNAAIVLLAVLLVLTFFSNTIMNRNLPEVSTQYVTDGTINAKVRGTGIVAANGNHQVKAEQTREIRMVMVKVGQQVEAGDVLFVLGDGDSSEIEQAQETLRQLQLSYQRSALGYTAPDYSSDQRKIDAAREEYEEAEQEFQWILSQSGDSDALSRLQEDMAKKQHELESATVERDAYKAAYDDLMQECQTALQEQESQRLKARQAVIEFYADDPDLPKDEDLENPADKVDALNEAEVTGEELDVWVALRDATDAVEAANASLKSISHSELDAAEDRVAALQKELDAIQSQIDGIMNADSNSAAYREAKRARDQAYDTYLDLQESLNQRKASDAKSSAMLGLELRELQTQIEEQKKKLAELSGGEENQVIASVSGTVQSIECTAGDTMPKDSVLCVLEVPDMGYTLSFSVTNDQAARLKVGDSASVNNYYWGREILATLESIRVDPKNPQTNKLLTFSVTGDVAAGSELTISVGQRSANFDTVVPKSALHSDSNGTFVYKIEAKNSPLGNRYIARRVNVEILAEDDSNAAVSGDLSWGDYVIITSNAPFKNGDMVRLSDN